MTKLPGEYESEVSAYGGHDLSHVQEISDRVLKMVKGLGITDSEQLIAAAAVKGTRTHLEKCLKISKKELERMIQAAGAEVPKGLAKTLLEPTEEELSLGALDPPDEMKKAAHAIPMMTTADIPAGLPESTNHAKKMPPVRNQASRGTCVAFSVTALHEFHSQSQNQPQDFSEQHLYYETKLIDGYSAGCGTWVSKAREALAAKGQCRENVWPYNPNLPCNNHGATPTNVGTDGADFRLQTTVLNPKDVVAIKTALAGGSVVPFAVPVYDSWMRSAETRRTGRITMRIGSEAQNGGHAMCLIGYQNDASAPGGGYFILRNSWGTGWGSECPYGAGNGTIPYKYITDENNEAITALPSHLVNVTYNLEKEFPGAGQECWIRFPFFRISNLHPSQAVRINRLQLCSWSDRSHSQLVDSFEVQGGGILEPGETSKELLLKGVRLRANGNRRSWSYYFTSHYWYTWWQRSVTTAATAEEPIEVSDKAEDQGKDDTAPSNDRTGQRTITIETSGANLVIR